MCYFVLVSALTYVLAIFAKIYILGWLNVLFFLFLAAGIKEIYASENPLPVGSNVTLFSRENVTTGAWLFESNIIVFIIPGGPIITNTWLDRVTFNLTTSSLTIKSLQLEESGLYTLQGVNSFRAQLTLSVQGKDHFITFIFTHSLICSPLLLNWKELLTLKIQQRAGSICIFICLLCLPRYDLQDKKLEQCGGL